jgi:hypothetical protein
MIKRHATRMKSAAMIWFMLGFTYDAVVGAWQDARLATECARVRDEAGRPMDFELLQVAGDEKYVVVWFVSERAAELLDTRGVKWRQFLIGMTHEVPKHAHAVLR